MGVEYQNISGYFRFQSIPFSPVENKIMLLAASTTAGGLGGSFSWATVYPDNRLEWHFGAVSNLARRYENGKLVGATYAPNGELLYTWVATPISQYDDDYASTLGSITMNELNSMDDSNRVRFNPVTRSDASSKVFTNLNDLIDTMKQSEKGISIQGVPAP